MRTPLVSLSALMGDVPAKAADRLAGEAAADRKGEGEAAAEVDAHCAEKLEAKRGELLAAIREMRPRFAAVFEQMRFKENRVAVAVPTAELKEEILRSRTELLLRMKEVAGVQGALELDLLVDERMRASLPIRLEDRLAYLSERNADLAALRKALDLETEG